MGTAGAASAQTAGREAGAPAVPAPAAAPLADRASQASAPPEAWQAFRLIGVVLVVTWGIVAVMREQTRHAEVMAGTVLKCVDNLDKPTKEELKARTEKLERLVESLIEDKRSVSEIMRSLRELALGNKADA